MHSKIPNTITPIGVAMAKDDEEFSFETIAKVYREERKSTTLTKLPNNFYRNLMDYIERLHQGYLSARKDDPTSPKTVMLEDEYFRSQKRAHQIYEYRERKVTTLALSAVNGGNPKTSSLTNEEKTAFKDIVETLTNNRGFILSVNERDACEPASFLAPEKDGTPSEVEGETGEHDASFFEEKSENIGSAEMPSKKLADENQVILIMEDIPSFETEDRSFNLKKDDVITLPTKYASVLCRNEKARVISGHQ